MMSTTRRFHMPGDAGKKLFENSSSLQMTIMRSRGEFGAMLTFELFGGFTTADGDLQQIATDLLRQFSELPSVGGDADDSDD